MRKLLFMLIPVFMTLLGCGTDNKVTSPHTTTPTNANVFCSDSTLEVVTWNLETFPKHSQTVERLVPLIKEINADLYAFQEIDDVASFQAVARQIPGYSYCIGGSSTYEALAYLYKTSAITMSNQYCIYTGSDYSAPFPRAPHVMEFTWKGIPMRIVNNHYKAMGDNHIDLSDNWDDETRRLHASQLLDEYISTNWANDPVIVVGDMNDRIEEVDSTNVFTPFLNQPSEYQFADMALCQSHTYGNYSYPGSSSNLDHILITNELFSKMSRPTTKVKAINIETSVGSWSLYDTYISDHRPVGLKIDIR